MGPRVVFGREINSWAPWVAIVGSNLKSDIAGQKVWLEIILRRGKKNYGKNQFSYFWMKKQKKMPQICKNLKMKQISTNYSFFFAHLTAIQRLS